MLKAVSGPISRGLPANVVCDRVKKQDHQVCELQYGWLMCQLVFALPAAHSPSMSFVRSDREVNINEIDFSKEKVKTLKKLLMDKYSDPCKVASSSVALIYVNQGIVCFFSFFSDTRNFQYGSHS
jgi:hypothetical protein